MPAPRPIDEAGQLVVEGRDAEVFFRAMLRHLGLARMQVQCCGGVDELPGFLKALRNAPGFTRVVSLGIVRDAETGPKAAFQSVCSALRNAGLAEPRQPELLHGENPRVTILILPSASTAGMLETICLQAVAHDPAIRCVDAYFDCLAQRLDSLPANMSKARVHAFLASRPKPDLLIGEAASAGYWPWDSPAFDHVKRFLQAL